VQSDRRFVSWTDHGGGKRRSGIMRRHLIGPPGGRLLVFIAARQRQWQRQ
jgi:hypothetical protein